jgi:tyrosine-protein kinase Etk/Wzc
MAPSEVNTDLLQKGTFERRNYGFVIKEYLKYWYVFLTGLLLSLGGAYLFLRYTTPQYSITSLLMIKDKKSENTTNRSEQFSNFNDFGSQKNIENEVIVLKSVSLMQRVLTELSLNSSYYIKGRARNQEIYQSDLPFQIMINKLDSTAFNKSITVFVKDNNTFDLQDGDNHDTYQIGQLIRKPYCSFTIVASPNKISIKTIKPIIIRFHDIRKLAIDYSKSLNVSIVNKQASVLSLNLVDSVPKKGIDILNKLVEVYNKEAVEDKNSVATNTINFIDERLKYLGTEVSNVERRVEQFKQKNNVADVNSQIHQSLEEASGYNKQISDYGIQISILESIEKYVRQPENQQQLIPSTLAVQDANLSGLILKFNELQLERERQLRTVQASNPIVESINEQLTNLRTNILENLSGVKNNLSISRRNLQAKAGQFGSRIQQVPTIERGLEEITREQDLKRSLYLYLLQKREEAALSLAATVSTSRVIDAAMAGDSPISPRKPTVFLLAVILGLGVPFAFVYAKGFFNDKLQTLDDVEWMINSPILGEIAYSKSTNSIVIDKDNRSPIAEMLRLIRTNFQFASIGKSNKVILVTSSMSGEGKTFFSLNFGSSLVLTQKKVVVINLDLRKANTENDAQLNKGVTDYLSSDSVSIDDIVQNSLAVPGLFIINTGQLPPNPAELMMSPKLGRLIDILRESFDYIIIDSAPVGQVADSFALTPFIDATIYLARYNFTLKSQLEMINKIQEDNKLKQLMLVLNGASNAELYGYSYGYDKSIKKKYTKESVIH